MMREQQDEIVELLQGDPYFEDIAGIVTQRKGDVDKVIAEALAGLTANAAAKVGIAVIVIMPLMEVRHPNVPGPFFDEITPLVRVLENPVINTIGKSAEEVTEYAAAVLHGRRLESAGTTLQVKRILLADDPTYPVGYDLLLAVEGGLEYHPEQVALPELEAA